jgi:hypothetical protein
MSDGNSLINLGDISKPATVFIEKISDAIGGYFKPHQIKRIAKAESEAEIIRAQAQIEVTDLQRRAMVRWVAEEARKQDNIEKITLKAITELKDSSKPEKVEDDWIVNFFDKCRIISDEEMQSLWAKVLAGEANSPGKYSRRTVNLLSSLDITDARLFTSLCGFGWFSGDVIPLIFDTNHPIYNNQNINFATLSHLDDIGLLSFNNLTGFKYAKLLNRIRFSYFGTLLNLEFIKEADNELSIGLIMLTKTGQQLAHICDPKPVDGFFDYVMEKWIKEGLILSSPYPRMKLSG